MTSPPDHHGFELPDGGCVSRRRFLRTCAVIGSSATVFGKAIAAAPAAEEDSNTMNPIEAIDAHVHVWTPDRIHYPLAAGFRLDEMRPPSFTPDELFAHARPCGVKRVVLIQMSFYGFDNSYMLDAIEQHSGVFSGVAVIDDSSPDAPGEMRVLAKRGVRGFRIYPRNLPVDRWLDGETMAAMWKRGAEDGLAMCHLVNPDALPAIDAMCARFAQTPVVIDHFARIGVDGVIRDADVDQLCRLARHPQTYVKLSAFYALGKKQPPYLDLVPMIRRLLDAFGPERLMWGTDCPFQLQGGQTYNDSISLVRDRLDFLSDSDRQWILRKTAEGVFFS